MAMVFNDDCMKVCTSDFWYDLTKGGYIKPELMLEDADEARRVRLAINVILQFQQDAMDKGVLEEC